MNQVEQKEFDTEWNIHYSASLVKRHVRFYRNLNAAFTLTTLLSGSAVAVGLINTLPFASSLIGLIIVSVTLVQFVIKPGEKRVALKEEMNRYLTLLERLPSMTTEEAESAFWAINKADSDILNGLSVVALHDTYLEIDGRVPPAALPMTRWNLFLRALS